MTRLSRFGIGPKISLASLAYGALAGTATYAWPDVCLLRWLPYTASLVVGLTLLAIGILMWLISAVAVMRAYNRDQLVTSGLYGLVRHPLYAAFIVFGLPGIALLTRSWPLMLTPLVAYTVFKLLIQTEDEYLLQRFGQDYLDYRARVGEVFPFPRR